MLSDSDYTPFFNPPGILPSVIDNDPVAPEDIPPTLGTPAVTYAFDWGWAGFIPVVVHTWLTLSVQATDNGRVAGLSLICTPPTVRLGMPQAALYA